MFSIRCVLLANAIIHCLFEGKKPIRFIIRKLILFLFHTICFPHDKRQSTFAFSSAMRSSRIRKLFKYERYKRFLKFIRQKWWLILNSTKTHTLFFVWMDFSVYIITINSLNVYVPSSLASSVFIWFLKFCLNMKGKCASQHTLQWKSLEYHYTYFSINHEKTMESESLAVNIETIHYHICWDA